MMRFFGKKKHLNDKKDIELDLLTPLICKMPRQTSFKTKN
jgi:hypothetical protein